MSMEKGMMGIWVTNTCMYMGCIVQEYAEENDKSLGNSNVDYVYNVYEYVEGDDRSMGNSYADGLYTVQYMSIG